MSSTESKAGRGAYTSGPWRVGYARGYGKGGIFSDDPLFSGEAIAGAYFPPDYSQGALSDRAFAAMEANARLIAAAPDLLAAIQRFLAAEDVYEGETEDDIRLNSARDHMRAVAARATGESSQ